MTRAVLNFNMDPLESLRKSFKVLFANNHYKNLKNFFPDLNYTTESALKKSWITFGSYIVSIDSNLEALDSSNLTELSILNTHLDILLKCATDEHNSLKNEKDIVNFVNSLSDSAYNYLESMKLKEPGNQLENLSKLNIFNFQSISFLNLVRAAKIKLLIR